MLYFVFSRYMNSLPIISILIYVLVFPRKYFVRVMKGIRSSRHNDVSDGSGSTG